MPVYKDPFTGEPYGSRHGALSPYISSDGTVTAGPSAGSYYNPTELPVQEMTPSSAFDYSENNYYDPNTLLTGSRDLDLDYLRQLHLIASQNSFNLEQQNQYRSWLESMSNSAYQRAANDLKSAGYNPALLLSSGGASVPSSGYSESASGSVPSSATGYNLKQNYAYLKKLATALSFDKFNLDANVKTSKEVRSWLYGLLGLFIGDSGD